MFIFFSIENESVERMFPKSCDEFTDHTRKHKLSPPVASWRDCTSLSAVSHKLLW